MLRPWRRGPARGYLLALAVVMVLGLGWAFGTRAFAIRDAAGDVRALWARDQAVHAEIAALRQKLVKAPLPQVVEREARQRLHWGFPDEERIVIVRR
ncbi:MAG: hypothetical protein PHZ21_04175 [Candidatus Bipolaricaulis sp.]|nr:hypothetical protein [Candidatus Bipolaricaulis sp.]